MAATRKLYVLKGEEKRLYDEGWRSMGDVPYILSRREKRNAGTLVSNALKMLRELVREDTLEYREANMRRFGRKTYVSPALLERLALEVRKMKKERGR